MCDQKKINDISSTFTSTLIDIVRLVEKAARNEFEYVLLDRFKQRINLFRKIMGDEMLIKVCHKSFIWYAPAIINRDDSFFLHMDHRAEFMKYNKTIKDNDSFFFDLIDVLCALYKSAGKEDREYVFEKVQILVDCSLTYANCILA